MVSAGGPRSVSCMDQRSRIQTMLMCNSPGFSILWEEESGELRSGGGETPTLLLTRGLAGWIPLRPAHRFLTCISTKAALDRLSLTGGSLSPTKHPKIQQGSSNCFPSLQQRFQLLRSARAPPRKPPCSPNPVTPRTPGQQGASVPQAGLPLTSPGWCCFPGSLDPAPQLCSIDNRRQSASRPRIEAGLSLATLAQHCWVSSAGSGSVPQHPLLVGQRPPSNCTP